MASDLHDALTQIAEIRSRLAETEVYRGYRAFPVALSGVLAAAAACLQPMLVPVPTDRLESYVLLWASVALGSLAVTGIAILLRDRFGGPMARVYTRVAVGQFVPSLLAGAAVTLVIVRVAPEAGWLLPGIWQVLFSQGVFASCRLLPRPLLVVGAFYLCTGAANIALARGDHALSPWAMAVPFGIGQLAIAAILFWSLERSDGKSQ